MKEKIKKIIFFILNPKVLFCLGIAWLITNGWAYIMFAFGTWFEITWMIAVASTYLTFLWIPGTPEKIVTFIIAIALLKWLFPKDEKTLAVLVNAYNKTKEKILSKKEKRKKSKNNTDKSE